MSSKSMIALAVAIVLGAASTALSASKRPAHPTQQRPQAAAKRHVPPDASLSFEGPVRARVAREPGYIEYQDMGIRDSIGD